jgi:hypothetical protein
MITSRRKDCGNVGSETACFYSDMLGQQSYWIIVAQPTSCLWNAGTTHTLWTGSAVKLHESSPVSKNLKL